jgi:hypothetical protein
MAADERELDIAAAIGAEREATKIATADGSIPARGSGKLKRS